MASLATYFLSDLVGFFSYSRDDDRGSKGALSALREAIQWELSAQLGRAEKNFRIWQDRAAIPVGTDWEEQIKLGISQSAFFIPIITPRVFNSESCAFEFESFVARERELGRADLIFPLLYIPVPELDDESVWRKDRVLKIVGTRQYFDWRSLRHLDLESTEAGLKIEEFCRNVATALRKPWESPEERQQRLEAAAQQKQAAEEQRRTAEIQTQRLIDEESQRRATEAARVAEDKKRREQAELDAREREAEVRRQQEALAARRAEEQRVFVAAKRTNTVAAFAGFLDVHAASDFADEAQRLKAALLARQEAHGRAMVSDDFTALRTFCKTYKDGTDVDEVRARLRAVAPAADLRVSRSALLMAATLAAVVAVVGLFWVLNRPLPTEQTASTAVGPTAAPAKAVPAVQPASPQPAPKPAMAAVQPAPPPPSTNTPLLQLPKTTDASAGTGPAVTFPQGTLPTTSLPAAAPLSKPAAPPALNLDKWASCAPIPGQKTDFVGGPVQPKAILKPVLTAAKEIRAVAISPDSATLVTAGDDNFIRVWSAADLKWIRTVSGHTAAVRSVAFSADGNLLASASFDGTVRVWDAHTFALMSTFSATNDKGAVKQYSAEFEPTNGPRFVDAVGADGLVRIWDLRSGQLANHPSSSSSPVDPTAGSLSFAPGDSGSFVTANYDGTVKFFDPGRADTISAFPAQALRVAYSPNGKLVASAGVDDTNKTVRLWNVPEHTLFSALQGHSHSAVSLAWSRDGKQLVSGGGYKDLTARVWDVQSGRQLQKFSGHIADIEAVAFHPNQKWLISASEDATMKIWNRFTGEPLLSIVGFTDGQFLAYAPNGCYTGSANAAKYVKYVTKDAQGHEHDTGDNGANSMFVPSDSTALLLPQ